MTRAMTEECRKWLKLSLRTACRISGSLSDCTVEYLDLPFNQVVEEKREKPKPVVHAAGPAVGAAIVAGLWLVTSMCFGGVAAKLFANQPGLAAFFNSSPLFTAVAKALSCPIGHARAAVAFGYAVCTSAVTNTARLTAVTSKQ